MNAPCMNCTDRTLKCHDNCTEYKTYKTKLDSEKRYIDEKKRSSYKALGDFPISYNHFHSNHKNKKPHLTSKNTHNH